MNNFLYTKLDNLIRQTKAKYISSNSLYDGKFIKLIKETYKLPNNKIITRERIIKNEGKESIIIIAITEDNKYILVSQNRINNIVTLEFPSGYIENKENIIEATTRELREETGYICKEIILLDRYYPNISIDSSVINIVIATNCIKKYPQAFSDNEYINYEEFTLREIIELAEKNIINSGGNKLAIYKYLYYLNNKNRCKTLQRSHHNIDMNFKK